MADIVMEAEGMTVLDAIVACGVEHDALFMDETQAQRIANDIFDDRFDSCLDITFKELDEHSRHTPI